MAISGGVDVGNVPFACSGELVREGKWDFVRLFAAQEQAEQGSRRCWRGERQREAFLAENHEMIEGSMCWRWWLFVEFVF